MRLGIIFAVFDACDVCPELLINVTCSEASLFNNANYMHSYEVNKITVYI